MNRPVANEAVLASLRALVDSLLQLDPDMATDDALFLDTIDGETDVLDQLRKYVRHAIENEAMADALTKLRNEMLARRVRLEARAELCRNHVRDCLEALGIDKLPAPDFTATIRRVAPTARVTDLDALPPAFRRVIIEADLIPLGKALRDGQHIPGAELSNAHTTLSIRKD